MKIIQKIVDSWNNYWNRRLEKSIAKDRKKETLRFEKEEREKKEVIEAMLDAEKDVIEDAIKNLKLERFQYKVVCNENFYAIPGNSYPSYFVFIIIEQEADFRTVLEQTKPERLYVLFSNAAPLGFYDEQRYGNIYIPLSDKTFIEGSHVILTNPPSYKPRGIIDTFPYVLREKYGDDRFVSGYKALYEVKK